MESDDNKEACWRTSAIRQGWLIKVHRGLVKAPKMQYFVLTQEGLVSFNYKPHKDTVPLNFLKFEQLSSIKVEELVLNGCKLPCLLLTSKSSSNVLLAFSRKEERDEWMVSMMAAFSEALVATRPAINNRTIDMNSVKKNRTAATTLARHLQQQQQQQPDSTPSYQTERIQRRKRNRVNSLQRSKSCNSVAELQVKSSSPTPHTTTSAAVDDNSTRLLSASSYEPSMKRKSLSDIHVITHDFPFAWVLEDDAKSHENRCLEICGPSKEAVFADHENSKRAHAKLSFMSRIRSRFEHSTKIAKAKT